MTYGTKAAIKAAYLEGLKAAYDWTRGPHGETGLAKAGEAADAALAGRLKLEGAVWFAALAANGVQKGATRAMLAALPD